MKQRVRFVDAPPPLSGPQDPRAVWMQRLSLLVERPGEWAEVYSGTPAAVNQAAAKLRLRQYHIPPGGWDFTVRSFRRTHLAFRREEYVTAVLYARFLGPDEEAFSGSAAAFTASDAVWDQYGRRICPVCERNPLVLTGPPGAYPSMCDECAWASAVDGVEHGTEAAYKHGGCRCPDCRGANREAVRTRRDRQALAETVDSQTLATTTKEGR